MPIQIKGTEYLTAADIHRTLGIVRQTLWRWRRDRRIPQGRRYRGRNIVFTPQELEAIREYAERLEPAEFSAASPPGRRPREGADKGRMMAPRDPRKRVAQ